MPDILSSPPPILLGAVPFFALLLLIELLVDYRQKHEGFETKDTLASLSMGVGNLLIGLAIKFFVLGIYWLIYDNFSLYQWDFSIWWTWVIVFFLEDFTYYWFHRISHTVRYFWASHVVHHSSQHYNLSTALRQTWTGTVSGSFVFWIWLVLIGVHPIVIGIFQSASLIYQFWIHTEKITRLPKVIELIFNTPSHHRVHHSSETKYLDKNHAGVLIIWDRMFGTFKKEENKPVYGLTSNIQSHNPIYIAFHEWLGIARDISQKNINFKQRLNYLFGPPGYSHDGSRKTSKELQSELSDERFL